MIDLSFAGLVGAIAGTVVAAILYHVSIGALDQAMRARAPSQTVGEGGASDISLSIIRRVVFTIDLLVFVALGYWLGRMFDE